LAALVLTLVFGLALVTSLWRKAERHADEANRTLGQARESLAMYTAIADKIFADPHLVSKEDRETLLRAQELQLSLLEKLNDPEELQRAAWRALQLANGLYRLGEYNFAVTVGRRAADSLRRVSEEHPERPDWTYDEIQGRWAIACFLIGAGAGEEGFATHAEALRDCEALVRRHPNNFRYRISLAAYQARHAHQCAKRGRAEEAERLFHTALEAERRLLARQPGSKERYIALTTAVYWYGEFLLKHHRDPERYLRSYQELIDLCEKVRRDRREDWSDLVGPLLKGYAPVAQAHHHAGRTREAMEVWKRSAALTREMAACGRKEFERIHVHGLYEPASYLWLTDPAEGEAKLGEAITRWEEVVTAHGGAPVLRAALAEMLLTCPARRLRDVKRALALARQAVDVDPASSHLRGSLGRCLCAAGHFAEARAELEACLAKMSADEELGRGRYRAYLAIAKWHLGERDSAKGDLEAANRARQADWFHKPWDWEELDEARRLIHGASPPHREPLKAPAAAPGSR
jgi:tetratricopeptide (TPR) repeat protein